MRQFLIAASGVSILWVSSCSSASVSNPTMSDPDPYVFTTYLDGLDEYATYIKTPRSTVVKLDDGRTMNEVELQTLEARALRQRFGGLTPAFARYLRTIGPRETIKAGFFFKSSPLTEETQRALRSPIPSTRSPALAVLRTSIQGALPTVIATASKYAVHVITTYDTMPVVIVQGEAANIEKAAAEPIFTLAASADATTPVRHVAKNGVTDPHIDTVFNSANPPHWGAGQKIGIVEDAKAGLYDAHEAFQFTTPDPTTNERITYQDEPPDCTTVADCPNPDPSVTACATLNHPGQSQNQCVTIHASECASVAAGSTGGTPYGAAEAQYFYANHGDGTSTSNMCNPPGLINAYDWLVSQGVPVAWESWGCDDSLNQTLQTAATMEGLVEDWYSRNYDIAILKSAGNQRNLGSPNEPACPYTLNSTCVGANSLGANEAGSANHYGLNGSGVTCYSSWTNLSVQPGGSDPHVGRDQIARSQTSPSSAGGGTLSRDTGIAARARTRTCWTSSAEVRRRGHRRQEPASLRPLRRRLWPSATNLGRSAVEGPIRSGSCERS